MHTIYIYLSKLIVVHIFLYVKIFCFNFMFKKPMSQPSSVTSYELLSCLRSVTSHVYCPANYMCDITFSCVLQNTFDIHWPIVMLLISDISDISVSCYISITSSHLLSCLWSVRSCMWCHANCMWQYMSCVLLNIFNIHWLTFMLIHKWMKKVF